MGIDKLAEDLVSGKIECESCLQELVEKVRSKEMSLGDFKKALRSASLQRIAEIS